ncbi:glucose 1-dehydrogenase [Mycobacteroides chelonae]|jgi:3alpha(or 20beta)-hydroxysteroid dehydrogenase|uniref:3-alpha-hydroxysteroid dehydrogenase n=1 Tax=Mycobacteroides chelonae TaxID=1774 RepID=A0A1S1KAI7_MYCCH|nr:glucose 1-dehydrogenase [Mycobacteroides chelonae]AMW22090.1 3-alpha-(or 20-beta)-hydroxysteroid dehydrogenase [Mycobacterium sp. QIA-37]SKL40387.1 3-alpha-(or 20-beta)-hydroxysteroid dehydrogenase [Mycobacteroides abscessus subsp. bolletii]MBF9329606.1 glucose 1-dehydrogenase [Mycobacteroides chelonae]MBF9423927.1 glucose 1-dehydrogenase [Mycobacteroides chelonae]MBF9437531.1 glucose 1-dehydrogenase [Mycobacteroides chelonae]
MGRVTGKIALISGGARGMGAAHARALVDEGAHVVIGDLLDEAGQALAADLGPSAHYVHLDVTDKQQWIDAVAATNTTFGPVNVLINNAGIANGNLLTDFELSEWQRILDINLTGTFLGCQAVAQTMIDNKAGSIINISSVEGYRGSPGLHGYTATKFAVRGLTKSVALELAPHGVRVNSVHPGLIRTDMTAGIPEDFLQIPLGRAADPAEVSALVLYLASDESSYSTAAEFLIDGGLIAGVPHKTS